MLRCHYIFVRQCNINEIIDLLFRVKKYCALYIKIILEHLE